MPDDKKPQVLVWGNRGYGVLDRKPIKIVKVETLNEKILEITVAIYTPTNKFREAISFQVPTGATYVGVDFSEHHPKITYSTNETENLQLPRETFTNTVPYYNNVSKAEYEKTKPLQGHR